MYMYYYQEKELNYEQGNSRMYMALSGAMFLHTVYQCNSYALVSLLIKLHNNYSLSSCQSAPDFGLILSY